MCFRAKPREGEGRVTRPAERYRHTHIPYQRHGGRGAGKRGPRMWCTSWLPGVQLARRQAASECISCVDPQGYTAKTARIVDRWAAPEGGSKRVVHAGHGESFEDAAAGPALGGSGAPPPALFATRGEGPAVGTVGAYAAGMVVQQIMTTPPVCLEANASAQQAVALLAELDARHLPIVDGGALVGILSDRDLAQYRDDAVAKDPPVSALMSGDVLSVAPEAEVSEAIDLLLEHRVGALPVVSPIDGRLVGIVSYVDILRALRASA